MQISPFPAVEGFTERFSAAQKSSQAMQHFLPKRSSPSHPKMVLTKQPVKAAPPAVQPANRKRKGLSPAAAGPPLKTPLLCLLAPHSVPGADGRVFVKNTVVNIGSFHIAPTQPIAVIVRKIKHKNFQKETTFLLPLITSLRPPLGGLPLETIQPFATQAEAWQAIPRLSNWFLGIIKRGYTLKFAQRPPWFGGVVSIFSAATLTSCAQKWWVCWWKEPWKRFSQLRASQASTVFTFSSP